MACTRAQARSVLGQRKTIDETLASTELETHRLRRSLGTRAALCCAEPAAMVSAARSAYTHTFATLGQLIASIIGWDLVLEFTIGASAVAVGFAGYLTRCWTRFAGRHLAALRVWTALGVVVCARTPGARAR